MIKSTEQDLSVIAEYGELNEYENEEFQFYLEGQNPDEVDKRVNRLFEEIDEEIDCMECANCCKKQSPVIRESELWNISDYFGMDPETFKEAYLTFDGDQMIMKQNPCVFLRDNICSIYEFRPADCASYPHLDKRGIVFKLSGIMGNYSVCPIVFNVIENLKKEMDF
ncbi:MAG: YkgJ family cysteine cluster protein [Bacteroidales bacterium]